MSRRKETKRREQQHSDKGTRLHCISSNSCTKALIPIPQYPQGRVVPKSSKQNLVKSVMLKSLM